MFDFNKTLHRLTWHLAHRLTDWAICIFGMFVLVPKYVKWLVVNCTQLKHHAAMGMTEFLVQMVFHSHTYSTL